MDFILIIMLVETTFYLATYNQFLFIPKIKEVDYDRLAAGMHACIYVLLDI